MNPKKSTTKITVMDLPPSLNKWQRWSYHERDRVKKEWVEAIAGWILLQHPMSRFRAIGGLIRYANVRITYYFRTRHRRDPDNYTPKCIMDALKGQIIEDDRDELITLIVCRHAWDPKNPHTEIEIEEVNRPDGWTIGPT